MFCCSKKFSFKERAERDCSISGRATAARVDIINYEILISYLQTLPGSGDLHANLSAIHCVTLLTYLLTYLMPE